MPADSFSKTEILAVLKNLLDRGEEKIPATVVREALAPYRSVILQSVQSTFQSIDQLDQILRQVKERVPLVAEQSPKITEEGPRPPAENKP